MKPFGLFFPVWMIAAAAVFSSTAAADEYLTWSNGGESSDQITCIGGYGHAVRLEVADSSKTWWAVAVKVYGEAYGGGTVGRDVFTISFIDMDGKVYAQSEHPRTLFTNEPAWRIIKITPTELPSEFWVVVDFQPNKEKGVYVGYVNNGGGHSMLSDPACRLVPLVGDDGKDWQVDWCIEVRVRNKYKGKMRRYDPAAPSLVSNAKEPAKPEAKQQESEFFIVNYTGLDDKWGVSVLRLLDCAREFLVNGFGLGFPDKVVVEAGMDSSKETSVTVKDGATIVWNLKGRTELLPVVRGGTCHHLYAFCKALAAVSLRRQFPDSRIMPRGMEEGISSWMAAVSILYVEKKWGQKLWPIRYSYVREEGPAHLKKWIESGDEGDQARRYARLFLELDGFLTSDKHRNALKKMFGASLTSRDFMRSLKEEVDSLTGGRAPASLFPPDIVDPPFLWLVPRPDFADMATFAGIRAKRYKQQVILSYDDNSAESMAFPDPGSTVLFHAPPGEWKIQSLKLYCRSKGSHDGRLEATLLDKGFDAVGSLTVPLGQLKGSRPGWKDLGAIGDAAVSGPFMICLQPDPESAGSFELGCDSGREGGHSFRIVPGSHAEPPPGQYDWMVRIFLAGEAGLERAELDQVLKVFKKSIPR